MNPKPKPSEERCPSCQKPLRIRQNARYQYTECGLDNVVLRGVETRECAPCKFAVAVLPDMVELHRLIAESVAEQTSPLDVDQFEFLTTYLRTRGPIGYPAVDHITSLLSRRPYDFGSAPSAADNRLLAEPALRLAVSVVTTKDVNHARHVGDVLFSQLTNRRASKRARRNLRVRFDRKNSWIWD